MEQRTERRDEFAAVRNWIHEAAHADDEKFRRRLEARREALAQVMENLTPEQALFSPGEGEWSVEQVGSHVARFLRECSQISRRLAAALPPPTEKRKMGMLEEGLESYEEVKAAVAKGFKDLEAAIDTLTSPHDTTGTYSHPRFGPLNCRQWITFCFVHVTAHVRQIQRIQSSSEYPKN